MPAIEIYTQPGCPFCARALGILKSKSAVFREISAPAGTPARADAAARAGRSSVPQIFIDGRHIGGCDDLVALDGSGEFDRLLAA